MRTITNLIKGIYFDNRNEYKTELLKARQTGDRRNQPIAIFVISVGLTVGIDDTRPHSSRYLSKGHHIGL